MTAPSCYRHIIVFYWFLVIFFVSVYLFACKHVCYLLGYSLSIVASFNELGKKSLFHRYCIHNVKDGIQSQVYNIINESVYHSSQCNSVKVKKTWRKSQAQFREMLRKLRLRQNNNFLIKKRVLMQEEYSEVNTEHIYLEMYHRCIKLLRVTQR